MRVGATFDAAIVAALSVRSEGTSICPSEVARAIDPKRWRERLDDVRAAAVRLALANRIVVIQEGRVVDPLEARGPVRIRMAP